MKFTYVYHNVTYMKTHLATHQHKFLLVPHFIIGLLGRRNLDYILRSTTATTAKTSLERFSQKLAYFCEVYSKETYLS